MLDLPAWRVVTTTNCGSKRPNGLALVLLFALIFSPFQSLLNHGCSDVDVRPAPRKDSRSDLCSNGLT